MMRWKNFTFVWHRDGRRAGIRIAVWGWIVSPWRDMRIQIAEWVLAMLRVQKYFED